MKKVPRYKQKLITVETVALRKARELKALSRKQASVLLGISFKQIEQVENGRVELTKQRLDKYLLAYGISHKDFEIICSGKVEQLSRTNSFKKKKVLDNNDLRRSYKKIINKEVKVLTTMRRLQKLTQYRASYICGYPKCTIGHIENGRIELPRARIEHIVTCYGYTLKEFNVMKKSEKLKDELMDECTFIIENLDDIKLQAVQGLLKSFTK